MAPPPPPQQQKQWALVTGVSRGGMGEGHVRALLERGVSVFATAQDIKFLEGIEFDGKAHGASVACLELDVTDAESIQRAVGEVARVTGGRLDFLMNNAGYGYYMPLLDVDIEKARKQYDVNVFGLLAVTQAFFPLLRAAKGTVVNQASVAGIQGYNLPYQGIYSSSKAAVYNLSDLMRVEFSPFDVKVVTLVTGAVKTEFYNHKEGGARVSIPETSLYQPVRERVEKILRGSFAGTKGTDRLTVTRNTIAAILSWRLLPPRFIRQGFGAIKIWLIYLLYPVWLLDRRARRLGALDQLRTLLRAG